MSAQSIEQPYPIFTDADGDPLEAGYIWIGVENLNPITDPVAVYWDEALTQPAVQPIRTAGGYPVNAGTPARLYTASSYSILVQDRNGITVYSAQSETALSSSDAMTFLQAGTGAVERTAQAKMRDVVSVKDFGAVGDGAVDDTVAIQAAIGAVGNGVLFFPEGTYKTTAKLTTAYAQNIKLLGSAVYANVSIVAHHADHVLQYNYTIDIEGISFLRDSSYVASAQSNQKNGIHSDDTGGIILGAAYTSITNCVANGHYTGIRMHGTHQYAENNTCNVNAIGMHLIGAVHTIVHNATEGNTETGLFIQGNGHRVLSHYADLNCSGAVAQRGAVTVQGDQCNIGGVQFNDNSGAAHFYLISSRQNAFSNCTFYETSPRVTLYSAAGNDTFSNNFQIRRVGGIATVIGNSYHNFFTEGWTIAGGMGATYNPIGTELCQFNVQGAWGNGEIGAGQSEYLAATLNASHDQIRQKLHVAGNHGTNVDLEIVGAHLYIYGDGISQTVDVKLKLGSTTTGVGFESWTLASFAGIQDFGVEADSAYTQFSPLKLAANTRRFSFYVQNDGASALKGASAIVYYRLKSSGLFI